MTHGPENFWSTVRLLLGATRKRSAGRRKRQQELLHNRSGQSATDWNALGSLFSVLLVIFINGAAGFLANTTVSAAQRFEVECAGKIVVSSYFLSTVRSALPDTGGPVDPSDSRFDDINFALEARQIIDKYGETGGTAQGVEAKLRSSVSAHGADDLVSSDEAAPGLPGLLRAGPLAQLAGSLVLIWWFTMLVCQGEGLELDLQRRRHPMWEWLLSHPIPAGAVFFAEMLSPLAANPIYWSGPLFAGIVYGFTYGVAAGMLAAMVVGVPLTVAAASLGKALENAAVLRISPRSRGAMIGIMSWLGYASMMLFIVGLFVAPKIVTFLARVLLPFAALPWPWLRWFLGGRAGGSFSFLAGFAICLAASALIIAGAVWFSVWSTQQGLSGNFAADSSPSSPRAGNVRFGKDPLYRKEFLWFTRDRSAIVQTILVPLTVAGLQLFNLRGLIAHAQSAWNYLCGAAVLFGTYFLWVLGPKSLASEGPALWIALTWPRGLESLLKAKAWLWSLISTGFVALVLAYAVFLFPHDVWKIALLGVGWFLFARSMAEKAVTLVTVTSSSGEVEKIPSGRRWAAQLGMLTFSIGIITEQWHIAVMGIVYSWITAAAMWQNFRAHLPFLYDPWSEVLPDPPSLMHAMVAISILVEGGAVVTGMLSVPLGRDNLAIAQAVAYGICAVVVAFGTSTFLSNRNVPPQDVWCWRAQPPPPEEAARWWRILGPLDRRLAGSLLAGAGGGLVLGMFGRGYLAVLAHIPATAEVLRKSNEQMASVPNLRVSYAIMAIVFAPFAEEYLFRGLLFRALDREWGGWLAVLGSAAFFAIYHGPIAWIPVGLLGVSNALLFKKTGRLAPAVVLHMVYNAIVVF